MKDKILIKVKQIIFYKIIKQAIISIEDENIKKDYVNWVIYHLDQKVLNDMNIAVQDSLL